MQLTLNFPSGGLGTHHIPQLNLGYLMLSWTKVDHQLPVTVLFDFSLPLAYDFGELTNKYHESIQSKSNLIHQKPGQDLQMITNDSSLPFIPCKPWLKVAPAAKQIKVPKPDAT